MKNSARNVRALRRAIVRWQPRFRLLEGWKILLDTDRTRGGHIHFGKPKLAELELGPARVSAERYVYHELFHAAFRVAGTRCAQEVLAQDIEKHVFDRTERV